MTSLEMRPGLYSLLPIIDREKRQKEKELYLKRCAKVIKNVPLDIEQKGVAFRRNPSWPNISKGNYREYIFGGGKYVEA